MQADPPQHMTRANRFRGDGGGFFHVTHRCHDREFLLRFVRDRNAYRSKLLEHLKLYDISLLDYCITSNHVQNQRQETEPEKLPDGHLAIHISTSMDQRWRVKRSDDCSPGVNGSSGKDRQHFSFRVFGAFRGLNLVVLFSPQFRLVIVNSSDHLNGPDAPARAGHFRGRSRIAA